MHRVLKRLVVSCLMFYSTICTAMTKDGADVFNTYFGNPHNTFVALLVMLSVALGVVLMNIATKAMKDRRTIREFDDSDVFVVLLRGLMVMLLIAAIFAI